MKRRTEAGLSMVDADAGDRTETFGARSEDGGRQPQGQDLGASNITARPSLSQPEAEMRLMAAIVSRENMMTAYQRVMANKGAPGIDRMTVAQLKPYLMEHWPRIKEELLAGQYQPASVRGVTAHQGNQTEATRARRGAGTAVRFQRTRPLVECRGQPYERCLPKGLLRQARADLTA